MKVFGSFFVRRIVDSLRSTVRSPPSHIPFFTCHSEERGISVLLRDASCVSMTNGIGVSGYRQPSLISSNYLIIARSLLCSGLKTKTNK